jgi:hypothetical protein
MGELQRSGEAAPKPDHARLGAQLLAKGDLMIYLIIVAIALLSWTLGYRHGAKCGVGVLVKTCYWLALHGVPEQLINKALTRGRQ